jgi:hypothetical protein
LTCGYRARPTCRKASPWRNNRPATDILAKSEQWGSGVLDDSVLLFTFPMLDGRNET